MGRIRVKSCGFGEEQNSVHQHFFQDHRLQQTYLRMNMLRQFVSLLEERMSPDSKLLIENLSVTFVRHTSMTTFVCIKSPDNLCWEVWKDRYKYTE